MSKASAVIVTILIIVGTATWLLWPQAAQPPIIKPFPVAPSKPITQVPQPQIITLPDENLPFELPTLSESDALLLKMLNELSGQPDLLELLIGSQLIERFVITIDNLPSKELPSKKLFLQPVGGKFMTEVRDGETVIFSENAQRYQRYVSLLQALDAEKIATLYAQLYPLFQQVYQDLGYPDKYFNDRLMEVLDHLKNTPDAQEPIALAQPKVYYIYANSSLEDRSIGQRILLRIGTEQREVVKQQLTEIQQAIRGYMQNKQKVDVEH